MLHEQVGESFIAVSVDLRSSQIVAAVRHYVLSCCGVRVRCPYTMAGLCMCFVVCGSYFEKCLAEYLGRGVLSADWHTKCFFCLNEELSGEYLICRSCNEAI